MSPLFSRWIASSAAAAALAALAGGCATPLESARANFDLGRLEQAEASLHPDRVREEDRVLCLMERGAIRQARGDFEGSTRDFIAAADLIEQWETYSVSRGAASLAINDAALRYRGAPYERTLLHAMTALNHLALGHWENAAVEARRLLKTLDPETLDGYPDCAFARVVAGFCLEMIGDGSNARRQYEAAAALNPEARGVANSGRAGGSGELAVFVLLGRLPGGGSADSPPTGTPPRVEIEVPGFAPVSVQPLTDTLDLAFTTAQRELARRVAKTVARVMIKDQIAEEVRRSADNDFLGDLTLFVLIGLLERPDVRRWETLPRFLYAARLPYPNEPVPIRLRVRNPGGGLWQTMDLAPPTVCRGRTRILLYREIPPRLYY